jgi:hypothetical protein
LVEGSPPSRVGIVHFLDIIFQAHKNKLHRRIIMRKRRAVFDDFLNPIVNGVGRIIVRILIR